MACKEFIFFSTIPISHAGYRRFDHSSDTSSSHSSCSSSSWSTCQRVLGFKVRRRYGKLKNSVGVEMTRIGIQSAVRTESDMTRKSMGGVYCKKPFWEKVLFGSKKAQSVVLLNVITIVYGMSNNGFMYQKL